MKGFNAEFRDLDHYIRVITDRIWEGRRLGDIERYYSPDCAIESPTGVTRGVAAVIESTAATLRQFPDRRLLAEDVIVSGDEDGGFLSSHRIFSPMTHAGSGVFGAPTGKPVFARTIADCVCKDNRIVHEWLVRDQAAIARQIGIGERELARRWLAERGVWTRPVTPAVPPGYRSAIDRHPLAATYAQAYRRLWAGDLSALSHSHDGNAILCGPGASVQVGAGAVAAFWQERLAALGGARFEVEHLVANERPGRATSIAMRWRVHAEHRGAGLYGPATGRPVELLAISHADVEGGCVIREWVLIDEVAVWMQILSAQA